MPVSMSYEKSNCCGLRDCDCLDDDPKQPCWGKVVGKLFDDRDEDGCDVKYHVCRGHSRIYEQENQADYLEESTDGSPSTT